MKVLLIGLGSIAKKHISAICTLHPNAQIFALRSNATSKSNLPNVTDIYRLEEADISGLDFILIANPTSEHFSTIDKVSAFGKPLFIEKPLFSGIDADTEMLVQNILHKKITTYVACNLRFLECLQELKELLPGKTVNEVNVYCGSFLPDWRPCKDFRTVYSANKQMGGGVHIDLIHELDYVYWLFGKPRDTSSFFSSKSSLEISAYDYANYRWTYDNFSVSIILNYYRKDSKRIIEVVTAEGTYQVDLLKNTIDLNKSRIFASSQTIGDTYLNQMMFFLKNILKLNQQFNTIAEANTVLKLCTQD